MFILFHPRLVLPATGLLLMAGLIVRPQSGEWLARLRDWVSPANPEVARPVESPATPGVAAEGRVVAYEGAEVVVGTEVSGLIVRLTCEGEVGRPRRGPHRRQDVLRTCGRRVPSPMAASRRGPGGYPILRCEDRRELAVSLAEKRDRAEELRCQPPQPGVSPCPSLGRGRLLRPVDALIAKTRIISAHRRRGHGAGIPTQARSPGQGRCSSRSPT